jgi:outer membrane protein assembly factor BamB
MNRRLLRIAICLASMTVPSVFAQEPARPVVPGEVPATARRFEAARKLAGEGKWEAAADEFRKIIEEAGDDLVPLGPHHLIQARWLCHKQIASAPKETLRRYQDRVEAQTNAWLEEGLRERDARLLQRILTDAFCSRAAERALDALGDLAFERGDFAAAEASWRQLAPLTRRAEGGKAEPAATANDLIYPALEHTEPARARAKQLLARLFRGDKGFGEGIESFQALHRNARGELAGRDGEYVDILLDLAKQTDALAAPRLPESWPTLGGDASRQQILAKDPKDPRRLMRLCAEGAWRRYDLSEGTRIKEDGPLDKIPFNRMPPPPKEAEELVCCPIIAGDFVYVADSRRVIAYSLRNGDAPAWSYECPGLGNSGDGKPGPCSLTAAGDLLYARFGAPPQSTRPGSAAPPSFLVCIDAKSHRELWHAIPGSKPSEPAFFEGAPLVHEGRVYSAVTRFAGNQQTTAIHCYAAQQTAEASPLWRQDVCTAPATKVRSGRLHHLTLAGSNIVYCSHTGTIAAVDSQTGRRAWAIRYPVIDARPADILPSIREDSPCVYADGRLFAVPADADRLYCLDPQSGAALWERDRIEVTHLLGAADGRLIFTTPNGIRALLADTGLDAVSAQSHERGWLQPVDGKISPFGRGLLLGDMVLWPTREYGLLVLSQADGEQPDDLDPTAIKKIRPGNMAFGNDCLAVADKNELAIYVPPAFLIEERKKEVGEKAQSAAAWLRLAMAEADAGLEQAVATDVGMVRKLAGAGEHWGARDIRRVADEVEHKLFLELAARAGQNEEIPTPRAVSLLEKAAQQRFPDDLRLRALVELRYWREEPVKSLALVERLMADPTIDKVKITDFTGYRVLPVKERLRERVSGMVSLVFARDTTWPDEWDRRARRFLADHPEESLLATLQPLVERYPHSATSQIALLDIGNTLEKAQAWGAAAESYRGYLHNAMAPQPDRELARAGLARCLEKQQCHESAQRHAKEPRRASTKSPTATDSATEHIRPSTVATAYERSWHVALRAGERVLLSRSDNSNLGDTPIGAHRLIFALGQHLTCRSSETGQPIWLKQLGFNASYASCLEDMVMLGGRAGVACTRLDDGHLRWQASVHGRVVTFSDRPEPLRDEDVLEEDALSGFRCCVDYLYLDTPKLHFKCLQGSRRLIEFFPLHGMFSMHWDAPGAWTPPDDPRGRFDPTYGTDGRSSCLRTTNGRLVIVRLGRQILDADEPPLDTKPWEHVPYYPFVDQPAPVISRSDRLIGIRTQSLRDKLGPKWNQPLQSITALTGALPAILGRRDLGFAVILRNHGTTLLHLNLEDGKLLWSNEILVGKQSIGPQAVAFDVNCVYCAIDQQLTARDLKVGKTAWQVPLAGPSGQWQVVALGDKVFAYPADTQSTKFRLSWLGQTMEAEYIAPPEEKPGTGFPIVIHDAKTGTLMQRLNFMETKPSFRVERKRAAHVGLFPQMNMEYTSRGPAPTVFISPRRIVVALEGHAWGLTAGK